ncbi:hypothetical protein [Streptomyces sp. F001]|nr:hypothetical protein [Streptomyces sp. F001]
MRSRGAGRVLQDGRGGGAGIADLAWMAGVHNYADRVRDCDDLIERG